jgi:LPXTG-site transpeptidase (sortase) family protein
MDMKNRQNSPFGKIMSRKGAFLAVFFVALFASTGVLAVLDLLPEPKEANGEAAKPAQVTAASVAVAAENPIHIEIPEIGLEATIKNPSSTNVAVLDEALLTGAVRYPTSAPLGEEGNVILFGHSSYLPVVNNKSFKAFNGVQKLSRGDEIRVTGSSRTFVYEVTSVREADAGDEAIPLTASGHTLTIVTCDSFGQKSDRFIVTATLVESYPVGK